MVEDATAPGFVADTSSKMLDVVVGIVADIGEDDAIDDIAAAVAAAAAVADAVLDFSVVVPACTEAVIRTNVHKFSTSH